MHNGTKFLEGVCVLPYLAILHVAIVYKQLAYSFLIFISKPFCSASHENNLLRVTYLYSDHRKH